MKLFPKRSCESRLETKSIEKIFKFINAQLEEKGLIGQCFLFVDSSVIVTKTQFWSPAFHVL